MERGLNEEIQSQSAIEHRSNFYVKPEIEGDIIMKAV